MVEHILEVLDDDAIFEFQAHAHTELAKSKALVTEQVMLDIDLSRADHQLLQLATVTMRDDRLGALAIKEDLNLSDEEYKLIHQNIENRVSPFIAQHQPIEEMRQTGLELFGDAYDPKQLTEAARIRLTATHILRSMLLVPPAPWQADQHSERASRMGEAAELIDQAIYHAPQIDINRSVRLCSRAFSTDKALASQQCYGPFVASLGVMYDIAPKAAVEVSSLGLKHVDSFVQGAVAQKLFDIAAQPNEQFDAVDRLALNILLEEYTSVEGLGSQG